MFWPRIEDVARHGGEDGGRNLGQVRKLVLLCAVRIPAHRVWLPTSGPSPLSDVIQELPSHACPEIRFHGDSKSSRQSRGAAAATPLIPPCQTRV